MSLNKSRLPAGAKMGQYDTASRAARPRGERSDAGAESRDRYDEHACSGRIAWHSYLVEDRNSEAGRSRN